jgi:hypothetical protein
MRRISVGVAVAVSGLLIAWAGQSIWRDSPDPMWAAVAVLSAVTIALHPTISWLLTPFTGASPDGEKLP